MKGMKKFEETGKFDVWQLSELRKGISAGVDVTSYASHLLNARQMREIREGLLREIDVSIYADETIPWERMNRIRKQLQIKQASNG